MDGDTFKVSGVCKQLYFEKIGTSTISDKHESVKQRNISNLMIHGNIQYDFLFRSFVDTPFAQSDFAQHSVRSSIDVLIKQTYPIRINVSTRRSNSPFFKDINDVNVQFSQRTFLDRMKGDLLKQIPVEDDNARLLRLSHEYVLALDKVDSLQQWLSHPARTEELIKEKELQYSGRLTDGSQLPEIPSSEEVLKRIEANATSRMKKLGKSGKTIFDSMIEKNNLVQKDSLSRIPMAKKIADQIDSLKVLKDSLSKKQQNLMAARRSFHDSVTAIKAEIVAIRNPAELKEYVKSHKKTSTALPGGWKNLTSIQTLAVGRTWIDYSDLSVKNLSVTGYNIEVNPGKLYLASAGGKINYRFRDFIFKDQLAGKQSISVFRAGVGKKETNHFIMTWYDGRKNQFNSVYDTSFNVTPQRVMGVVAEVRLAVDKNNYLVAEIGRSSFTNSSQFTPRSELARKVWNLKDRSNQAYSVQAHSFWPSTSTSFNGSFRKMGVHFQSFSLQPINVEQVGYRANLKQDLWHHMLSLDLGVRKNDFGNSFVDVGLSSRTVFKSAQLTFRKRKLPLVSIGFFPSTQVTILPNNRIVENQYNTLTSIVSHSFQLKGVAMNSALTLIRFYNAAPDTGFIYYNARTINVTHSVYLRKIQLQGSFTSSIQRSAKIQGIEASGTWQMSQVAGLNGGVKCSKIENKNSMWGSSIGFYLNVTRFGSVSGSYDKSFLPGADHNLLPLKMARIGYTRTF